MAETTTSDINRDMASGREKFPSVQRRHVFYIMGYDPQGAAGYYRLFGREYSRFSRLRRVTGTLGEPEIDPDDIATRWHAETVGPNWRVSTNYEVLRWEDIIKSDMARPMSARLPLALVCFADNILHGTVSRILRESWRFGLFYLFPTFMLALTAIVPLVCGILTARIMDHYSYGGWYGAILGIFVAIFTLMAALALDRKMHVIHVTDAWIWINEWLNGRRPDFEERLEAFAHYIVARSHVVNADEILIVGHSAGGAICIPLVARILSIDPDFARHGPRVVVLDLGSHLLLAASHSRAHGVRSAIARVAIEPSVLWIEVQARKDVMSLFDCNPAHWVEVDTAQTRSNPMIWRLRIRDLLTPDTYGRRRWNFFRMHYQFIMANDRLALYDYFMLVCGPMLVADWTKHGPEMVASFGPDSTYSRPSAEGIA